MAYFDVDLTMLDGLSVDSGGVGSINRLWLDKLVINGDTTDMITAVVTRFNGSVSYLIGNYDAKDMSTSYAVSYHNPRQQTDMEFVYLTVQTPAEIQSEGLDNTLIFRRFKFPDDLPINYQPQLDDLDDRLDDAETILAGHENRIQETEKTIKEHSNTLNYHEEKIQQADKTIKEHTITLNYHEEKIQETDKTIKEQTNTLNYHENKIQQADKTIKEHTIILNDHEEKIQETDKTIKEHTNTLNYYEDKIQQADKTIKEHSITLNDHEYRIKNAEDTISEHKCDCSNDVGSSGPFDYRVIKTFELPLLTDDDWGNLADTMTVPGWLTIWPNDRFIRGELILPWRQCGLPGAPTHLNEAERLAIMPRLKAEYTAFDKDDTNALCQMGITCAMRTQSNSLSIQLGAANVSSVVRHCKFFITVLLRKE